MRNRIIFIIVSFILIYCIFIAPNGVPVSKGIRTGTIYKISDKGPWYTFGLMCWTWEGEMALNMPGTMMGREGAIWAFSVSDTNMANKLDELSRSGKTVTLKYKQKSFRMSCWGETSYDVVGIE